MDRKEKHTKVKEKVWDRVKVRVLKGYKGGGKSGTHKHTGEGRVRR